MKEIILILCIAGVYGYCFSQNNKTIDTGNRKTLETYNESDMNNEIISLMDQYRINASSILFSKNNIIVSRGYGKDGILLKNKITDKSVFEAGSIGKLIIAYIALELADQRKINLDDKIYLYLDKNWIIQDQRFANITIRNLISHTAGFSPSFELGIDRHIYFEPGSRFSYSGVGYMYLQTVIENVTGKDFESIAKGQVFDPLKMQNSTFSKGKTVTPFINTSSFVLYTLPVFIASYIMILIIGFITGAITKYKYFSKRIIFPINIGISIIANTIFILIFLSKLLILFAIFIIVGFSILLLTKKRKIYYLTFSIYTLIVILLGCILPISLPTTNDIIFKGVNCAYTLKTTPMDMSLFIDHILSEFYYNKDILLSGNMFNDAVTIDKHNSWGLGIAIERTNNKTTYWHSGINPGFQSLIVLNPEEKSYVIVFTNSDNGLEFSKKITRKLLNINGTWDIIRHLEGDKVLMYEK